MLSFMRLASSVYKFFPFIQVGMQSKHILTTIPKKVELERQAYLGDHLHVNPENADQLAFINHDLAIRLSELALFSYNAYRIASGEENPIDTGLAVVAAAYTLYQPAKTLASAIADNESVKAVTNRVFCKV